MALPIENFDSYTNGNALSGLNGGSGWAGAWSVTAAAGEATISNAQSVSSPNSLQIYRISTEAFASRIFGSSVTDGNIQFYVRRETVSPDVMVFQFNDSTSNAFRIDFNQAGNIIAYRSGGTTTIQAYTNNTWYKVNLRFDCATDTYTVEINDGGESSSLAFVNNKTSIDRWRLDISANGAGTPGKNWIDSFGSGAASSAIKTIDGLAKASVKTVDGLAIASVKSWNGLE